MEVRRAYDEWASPKPGTLSEKNVNGAENGLYHLTVAGDRHGVPDTDIHTPHVRIDEKPSLEGDEKV